MEELKTEISGSTIKIKSKNKKNIIIDLTIQPPYTFYESRTELGKLSRRMIRAATGVDTTKRSSEHKEYLILKNQKANCLVTVDTPMNHVVDENFVYRRLTPVECERLQTVPDGYTKSVSDSQRYKMLGNGWTVDVIAHIFSYLPK